MIVRSKSAFQQEPAGVTVGLLESCKILSAPKADARLRLRVAGRQECADGIVAFELAAADGSELPSFSAGSHIDVHLPGGMTRQYSLRNDPAERHRYCIGVLREPDGRGGSAHMHDRFKAGDTVETGRPRNAFELQEQAPFSVLLAGGIGITPILSMAHRLSALGRDFAVHYCARSRSRMAFRDEMLASAFAHKVRFHLDDGPAQQKLDLVALLSNRRPGAHLYACGPAGFLDAVIAAARNDWPSDAVHREYFTNAGQQNQAAKDRSFRVTLASDGRSFEVAPGRSIVEVLGENGIEIQVSCEQGICGTCVTRVISGVPDHRDLVLTEKQHAAGDRITPCCSRALSDELVLDL
ncbi:PDR/VanB family oxidoreductase [Mesorhizobium neociceri]|uniref:Oxidoreductase n=1 Tax=Mesorhizobium neociceri TaxID=1307853 RepID=A0A838B5G4_9HYPH|nr:PDR/VanB family oxidoreductase [Mesorhizobium neociceri]MBA1140964.1 oxidoreductase [Mesorhizobium neociceri]